MGRLITDLLTTPCFIRSYRSDKYDVCPLEERDTNQSFSISMLIIYNIVCVCVCVFECGRLVVGVGG